MHTNNSINITAGIVSRILTSQKITAINCKKAVVKIKDRANLNINVLIFLENGQYNAHIIITAIIDISLNGVNDNKIKRRRTVTGTLSRFI